MLRTAMVGCASGESTPLLCQSALPYVWEDFIINTVICSLVNCISNSSIYSELFYSTELAVT